MYYTQRRREYFRDYYYFLKVSQGVYRLMHGKFCVSSIVITVMYTYNACSDQLFQDIIGELEHVLLRKNNIRSWDAKPVSLTKNTNNYLRFGARELCIPTLFYMIDLLTAYTNLLFCICFQYNVFDSYNSTALQEYVLNVTVEGDQLHGSSNNTWWLRIGELFNVRIPMCLILMVRLIGTLPTMIWLMKRRITDICVVISFRSKTYSQFRYLTTSGWLNLMWCTYYNEVLLHMTYYYGVSEFVTSFNELLICLMRS